LSKNLSQLRKHNWKEESKERKKIWGRKLERTDTYWKLRALTFRAGIKM
jgi:hypothetical protein